MEPRGMRSEGHENAVGIRPDREGNEREGQVRNGKDEKEEREGIGMEFDRLTDQPIVHPAKYPQFQTASSIKQDLGVEYVVS